METLIVLTIGCFVAAFGFHWLVKKYSDWLKKEINEQDKNYTEKFRYLSEHMGYIERPLYVLSYFSGVPEFIGLWLSLKVAGGWALWSPKDKENPHIGRARFMAFMIVSGLSVALSVLIAIAAKWIIDN